MINVDFLKIMLVMVMLVMAVGLLTMINVDLIMLVMVRSAWLGKKENTEAALSAFKARFIIITFVIRMTQMAKVE